MARWTSHGATRLKRALAAVCTGTLAASALVLAGPAIPASADAAACSHPSPATSSELNSKVGITKTAVNVANVSIISGPVPGLFQGAPDGAAAYFAYLNSKGGVHGRKIILHSMDDGFSGTQNQAETAQALNSNFAMVGSFSLFDNYSCDVLAKNPAVSDVSATLDSGTNSLPNVFSPQPISEGAPTAGYLYLKSKYPKAVGHVASLVSNVGTAIQQWQGQEAAMKSVGYKFAYVRYISPLESNFTADVINMKNKGVTMVTLSAGTGSVYASLVKEMALQNFRPQVMVSDGPIYDNNFVNEAGGSKNTQGIWLIQDLALYLGQDAKNTPSVATFDTWMAKTNPSFKPDLFSVFGWSSAQLFAQALQAAGPNPTRGSLLAQLKKITSFSASGLVAPANPAKKIPPNCVLFARISNGKFARVTPTPRKGWDCSKPYVTAHGAVPKVNP